MASSKDFLEFVLEQLSGLSDVTYRAMMGEFIIYYHGKVIGGIYDNRFLVKPTKNALNIIPNAVMEIPYPKGKPMIMITDVEDKEFLEKLFNAIYPELAEVSQRKKN
ncbi:MAG: TfoX/Sxy family protein [Alphaproteobacteria bacterium]|nr:TfoX/Sxy family protein [Alphaproteobacteria bacterium]